MKNYLFSVILFLTSLSVLAQKEIKNPEFGGTTACNVKVTNITLGEKETAIDFEVEYFPKKKIKLKTKETYIQNSDGGEKFFVTRAEGIELDKGHKTPENGKNVYTLFFPPLDASIQKIDFIKGDWKMFDILLAEKKKESLIPAEIQGNWLRTDGSNEWVYGIYESIVVYKGETWKPEQVSKKKKKYQLLLKKGNQQEKIQIKIKGNKLQVSNSSGEKVVLSKEKTFLPDFELKNDEAFSAPVFKQGIAVYKGFIEGYHPKMGTTGKIQAKSILANNIGESITIKIAPDGSFSCEVPMFYPQLLYIRLPQVFKQVFLEPGKSLFEYIDLTEYTAPYKNRKHRVKRQKKSLFMGENARVNSDLLSLEAIYHFNHNKIRKQILDISPDEFKERCLKALAKEQEATSLFCKENTISKKAQQIKNMDSKYNAYAEVLSYNMGRSNAYRKKHKVSRKQRKIPLEQIKFESEFLKFIKAEDLNDQVSLLSGASYDRLCNRIAFSKNIRPKASYSYCALVDSIQKRNIKTDNEEKEFLEKLCTSKDYKQIIKLREENTEIWKKIQSTHSTLLGKIKKGGYHNMRKQNLQKYFGLESGLLTDILYSQIQLGRMKARFTPLDEAEKTEIKSEINTPFISDYLFQQSDELEKEIKEKLEANKNATGYVVNETPKTTVDRLFESIMEKYKGKVVYVDFWATWCGPCRSGIKKIKPLKEELKSENIEFVYITNQSSPLETWNMLIPDIKGEHYRLTAEEWNHLKAKFSIRGIPHYILVGENGEVINNNNMMRGQNEALKKTFMKYLKD